ncbi:resolvase [Clostridium perfringens]|nr:Transposon Tn3 resolvase [Clostridium perfringens]CAG9368244.1 resolvase [Clostridium perfringens]SQB58154.1 resolvase [Clostridium perfringens]STB50947.1 resolvase [Clostridium perfringens]SUY42893.1 resolvase [Clostridium perfringens]
MYKLTYRYGNRKRSYTKIFNSKSDMERYIESVKDKNLIVLDIELINEKKMLVGYARVSTEDQNLDRQIDLLIDYGVDKRNIYQEKISGTKTHREQLDKMIDELQEGDTVIIADLTRISRSTKDLLDIIDRIKAKGASIKSIKDTWLDTSSDNPYNSFLLTVMSGLSQLERDLISQRTKEGLKSAKARGRNGGRPSKRNDKSDTVGLLYKEGYKIVDIVKQTGLSRATVYRVLKDLGLKE